jgi:hypothetical protein
MRTIKLAVLCAFLLASAGVLLLLSWYALRLEEVRIVAASSVGSRYLVVCDNRGKGLVWDLVSKRCLHRLSIGAPHVCEVALSRSAEIVAVRRVSAESASNESSVEILSVPESRAIGRIGKISDCKHIAFRNDNEVVLFGKYVTVVPIRGMHSTQSKNEVYAEAGVCLPGFGLAYGDGWGDLYFVRAEQIRRLNIADDVTEFGRFTHELNIRHMVADNSLETVTICSLDGSVVPPQSNLEERSARVSIT